MIKLIANLSNHCVLAAMTIAGPFFILESINPNSAHAEGVSSSIKVYFSGVRVGKLKQTVSIDGDNYSISGSAKSNAVISIVANTKASYSSSGKLAGRNIIPNTQSITYKSGKKAGNATLTFDKQAVVKISATPAIKYKPGSVEVTQDHIKKVLDPVSSLIFPVEPSQVGKGSAICNRTVPIFDGKNRIDLKFSYKSSSNQSTKGFSGQVVTCRVKYVPVAGHRPTSKGTAFMMTNNNIEVSLARVANSNVYSLFGFTVPIRKGTVTGKASKYKIH